MKFTCPVCNCDSTDNIPLNDTTKYSGIEISLNKLGELRVRTYSDSSDYWESQDIINLKYCPLCRRKYK